MKPRLIYFALVAAALAVFRTQPALADMSGCDEPSVLTAVRNQFDDRAASYRHDHLNILKLDRIRSGHLEVRGATHNVERQHCSARALMSDGRRRTVWYLIERNWGFAGLFESVESCVSGLDPWHVYGRQCRSLR